MKSKIYYTIAILLLIATVNIQAQDIHSSQFFFVSPFNTNPALTGLFQGDMRFGGSYRNQWRSVTTNYRTMMFTGDASFTIEDDRQSIGLGGHFYSDIAGDLDFRTNHYSFSISSIRKFENNSISIGFQAGYQSANFDPSNIVSHQQETFAFASDFTNTNFFDLSVGALWYRQLDEKKDEFIYFGGSMYHINRPIYSFLDKENAEKRLQRKFVLHGGANLPLNNKSMILPNVIFMKQGPFYQLTAGSFYRYQSDKKSKAETAFLFGGWIRGLRLEDRFSVDALIAAFRVDVKQFQIAMTYDINISSLAQTSYGRGGPELSLTYLISRTTNGKPMAGKTNRPSKSKLKCPFF